MRKKSTVPTTTTTTTTTTTKVTVQPPPPPPPPPPTTERSTTQSTLSKGRKVYLSVNARSPMSLCSRLAITTTFMTLVTVTLLLILILYHKGHGTNDSSAGTASVMSTLELFFLILFMWGLGYCLCTGAVITLEVVYNKQMTLNSIQTHYSILYPPVACALYSLSALSHIWTHYNFFTTLRCSYFGGGNSKFQTAKDNAHPGPTLFPSEREGRDDSIIPMGDLTTITTTTTFNAGVDSMV